MESFFQENEITIEVIRQQLCACVITTSVGIVFFFQNYSNSIEILENLIE